ncbi:flagellin [uncultured Sneathiella sp.]|uniref:flagellin n=1 Tax=uncultured Sneathiella sp. TaxID=879315 RepID=UPI0030DCC168|tara:strand:+ start:19236 stop:20045 length:810 start_codon:yes stop_codon:yes gene_type:complete
MASINTNSASMAALRTLNMTQNSLGKVQSQLETGLRVNSAKDAPATFVIAQGMRADIGALNAVSEGIAFGQATIGMAMAGATAISDQLTTLKELATQAKNEGLDGSVIQDQVTEVLAQIDAITSTSAFNGVNLITATATTLTVPTGLGATDNVAFTNIDLSSTTGLALNTIDVSVIANNAADMATIDAAIASVGSALTSIGTFSSRLDDQGEFTQLLTDTMKEGLGVLVDADMAEVAAELTALQTKEQLNIQSLSIANSAPQTILALFR